MELHPVPTDIATLVTKVANSFEVATSRSSLMLYTEVEKMPSLKAMYSADDDNTQVLYFRNATATFSSFTAPSETVTF